MAHVPDADRLLGAERGEEVLPWMEREAAAPLLDALGLVQESDPVIPGEVPDAHILALPREEGPIVGEGDRHRRDVLLVDPTQLAPRAGFPQAGGAVRRARSQCRRVA